MAKIGKTQPQKLLEEIIPRDENERYPSDPEPLVDAPKFPTIAEQAEYWRKKEAAERPPELDAAFDRLEAAKREYEMNVAESPDEPKPPRKWSLARRRKFNATHAKKKLVEHPIYDYPPKEGQINKWDKLPTPPREPGPQISHCPFCGGSIERFLA